MAPVAGGGTTGSTRPTSRLAGDVDPRVGEHLLDVLALERHRGLSAADGRPEPDPARHHAARRPTDRLYVDRTQLADARDYMTRLTGGAAGAAPAEPTWTTARRRRPAERGRRRVGEDHRRFPPAPDRPPTAWPAAEGHRTARRPGPSRRARRCSRRPTSPASRSTAAAPTSPSRRCSTASTRSTTDRRRRRAVHPAAASATAAHLQVRDRRACSASSSASFSSCVPDLLPIDRDFVTLHRLLGDHLRRGDAGLAAPIG